MRNYIFFSSKQIFTYAKNLLISIHLFYFIFSVGGRTVKMVIAIELKLPKHWHRDNKQNYELTNYLNIFGAFIVIKAGPH